MTTGLAGRQPSVGVTKPAERVSDTYMNVSTPTTSSGDGIEAIEELTRPAASRKDTSSRTPATPSRTGLAPP
jgi:hypothetical protein